MTTHDKQNLAKMNFKLFNFWKMSVALGFAAFLISGNGSKAQLNSSMNEINDDNGKSVISYKGSYALVIWAGQYDHQSWGRLLYVEREAMNVKKALEKQNFVVQVVPNPTEKDLKKSIDDFFEKYGNEPDNRLILFYTGHGYSLHGHGYLVPVDSPDPNLDKTGFRNSAYRMNILVTHAINTQAKHVLIVLDSCFSGKMIQTKSSSGEEYIIPDNPENLKISSNMNNSVRQFLTAGKADQEVTGKKSIFTESFIDAITYKKEDADHNKDGYLTGTELGFYVSQKVSKKIDELNKKKRLNEKKELPQTPEYGRLYDPNAEDPSPGQGEFVFMSQ